MGEDKAARASGPLRFERFSLGRELRFRTARSYRQLQTRLVADPRYNIMGGRVDMDSYGSHCRRVGVVGFEAKVQKSAAGRGMGKQMTPVFSAKLRVGDELRTTRPEHEFERYWMTASP